MAITAEITPKAPFALEGEELRQYEIREWQTFKSRMGDLEPPALSDIEVAYNGAQWHHRGDLRKSGERYFNHPIRAALIIVTELELKDSDLIVEALLHDTGEDTNMWTAPEEKFPGKADLDSLDIDRIIHTFNPRIAIDLHSLTIAQWVKGKKAEEIYQEAFLMSSGRAQLVRLADRLDNLRTLEAMPLEKQVAKIDSTVFLIENYGEAARQYPLETERMIVLIGDAMVAARENLPGDLRNKPTKPQRRAHLRPRKRVGKQFPPTIHPNSFSIEELRDLFY